MKYITFFRYFILIGFFLSTLGLVVGVPEGVFVSPDENANAVFAMQLAQERTLAIEENLNQVLGGLVHSRSSIGAPSAVLPVSFLGLPLLYGAIGLVLGPWILPFLTALIATLAVIAWHSIVRAYWKDDALADMSALFLMIHPAFWYYSSRAFMHNVLFVSFLIGAGWFFICKPFKKQKYADVLNLVAVGVCLGGALVVRSSEVVWVAFVVLALGWLLRSTLQWRHVASCMVGMALALIPVGLAQMSLYGAPWVTGYTAEFIHEVQFGTEDAVPLVSESNDEDALTQVDQWMRSSFVFSLLFPFGIHERNIVENVWRFGVQLYPWAMILFFVGTVLAWKEVRYRRWLLFTLGVAAWLVLVYGSWTFHDNPDPNAITIGDSHVRYWLPAFVLITPLMGKAVLSIWRHGGVFRWIASCVVAICVLLSIQTVFFAQDGVFAARAQLFADAQKRDGILSHTPEESIVIVDYADKYLFPDRAIVVPLRSRRTYDALSEMLALRPVYYFGITLPPEDVEHLNTVQLPSESVLIIPIHTIGQETLYQFIDAQ